MPDSASVKDAIFNIGNYEPGQTGEVLFLIVVLAFILERALALVFDSKLYLNNVNGKGLSPIIAFLLSLLVVWKFQFDALGTIFSPGETSPLGYIVTAAVIAGGSKAAVELMRRFYSNKPGGQPAQGNQPGGG